MQLTGFSPNPFRAVNPQARFTGNGGGLEKYTGTRAEAEERRLSDELMRQAQARRDAEQAKGPAQNPEAPPAEKKN